MNTTALSTRRHRRWLVAVWFPIIGPLAAWAIHLVGEAALVRSAQDNSSVIWLMHGLSVVLGSVALCGMVVAYRLTRVGDAVPDGDRSGTAEGRTAFMGWLGLYAATFNFLLIAAEETVIIWVHLRA